MIHAHQLLIQLVNQVKLESLENLENLENLRNLGKADTPEDDFGIIIKLKKYSVYLFSLVVVYVIYFSLYFSVCSVFLLYIIP